VKNCLLIFFFFLVQSCTAEMTGFFSHKKNMEELHGPCHWLFVGIDTEIINPAIKIIPPVGKDYVLWNQECSGLYK